MHGDPAYLTELALTPGRAWDAWRYAQDHHLALPATYPAWAWVWAGAGARVGVWAGGMGADGGAGEVAGGWTGTLTGR